MAESFFATLKNELIYRHVWTTRRHAELAIFEFIAGWYNQHRRHSTLGYCSPAEVERRTSTGTLAAERTSPPKRVKPNPPFQRANHYYGYPSPLPISLSSPPQPIASKRQF